MTTTVFSVIYSDSHNNNLNLTLNVGPISSDGGYPVLSVSGTFNGSAVQYPVPTDNSLLPVNLTNEFYVAPDQMSVGLRSGFAFLVNSSGGLTGVAVLGAYNLVSQDTGWYSDNFFPKAIGNSSGQVYPTIERITGTVYLVRSAIYGAGVTNAYQCTASPVTTALQNYLDKGITQLVICNGEPTPNPAVTSPYPPFVDPAPGDGKVFAAWVTVNGVDQYFACAEGQTIDFSIAPINN